MRDGLIPEQPIHMGETLPGAKISYLDINMEKKIVEEKLRELQTLNAAQKEITSVMKDLGIQRAKLHGWPNTYAFTKAMGEMMILEEMKGKDYKLIILRPTINKTLDALFAVYGKGKLTFFLADPQSILDLIPGDMVVNAMVAAIAKHSKDEPSLDFVIYHVGKPIKVGAELQLLSSMTTFQRYIELHYLPYLKILKLLNVIFCDKFKRSYTNSRRALDYLMRLAELYKPYTLFQGIFDDANTEGLRITTREYNSNADMFGFDPKCIQWEEYFLITHFPGIAKYALK
ncbi:UNVERIFIED_CONTAM: Alcohol-forming fatty acyl-CoA reductase [Sesamum angustifolium]|uniref:Fatty acyl-CoA reductase n=1 Tax=Sesamum angustifolium TaxID=2727405 RepID=A0AAW2QNN6_9LAMI